MMEESLPPLFQVATNMVIDILTLLNYIMIKIAFMMCYIIIIIALLFPLILGLGYIIMLLAPEFISVLNDHKNE